MENKYNPIYYNTEDDLDDYNFHYVDGPRLIRKEWIKTNELIENEELEIALIKFLQEMNIKNNIHNEK